MLWLLTSALLLLRACAAHECAAGCTEHGNCNLDSGDCQCPYGKVGKACEVDMLSACRHEDPDSPASCGVFPTMSCECKRQCEAYHCRDGLCEILMASPDRGCFTRENLPPELQTSATPEEGEAGIAYYRGWRADAKQVDSRNTSAVKEVMRYDVWETVPLSRCKDSCNKQGFCILDSNRAEAEPGCRCHMGFLGGQCEVEDSSCYLGCNGHGKCKSRFFCHCEPGYFSLGCSRNMAVKPSDAVPSPRHLKIYMYELNSREAFHVEQETGEPHELMGSADYAGYIKFTEQFLRSPVRTEDPSEASLFFIPTPLYAYSKMNRDGNEHLHFLLSHLKTKFPYWNRTDGRDHFFFAPADRGGCHLTGLALQPIVVTHFGYYWPDLKTARILTIRQRGQGDGYSCYRPLRDVVAATHDSRHITWAATSSNMSVDQILATKTKLLFFVGGSLADAIPEQTDYSGNSRQILDRLDRGWKEPDFDLLWRERVTPPTDFDLEKYYRRTKFCFSPYGWGTGNRLAQAIVCNCIPVIVQENVFQAFEDILPYETFSIRLNNADLPRIREILRGISTEQYRGMMEELVRYRDAFHWWPESGGRAFDYTIASLRRRYLHLKSLFY